MNRLTPNNVHRTALLGAHDGSASTIEEAIARHGATGLVLVADATTCEDDLGQAALLTSLVTAVRAFGNVFVATPVPTTQVNRGVWQGQTLADVITAEGPVLGLPEEQHPEAELWATILLGLDNSTTARGQGPTAHPPGHLVRLDRHRMS